MSDLESTTPPLKTCTKCGREHPATREFFSVGKRYAGGLRSRCKECLSAYHAAYHAAHREERAAYYAEHREQQAAYDAAHYADHREEQAAYDVVYRAEHREEIAASQASWYVLHRDERAAHDAAYRAEHPEEYAAYTRNRRARKRGNGGTHTAEDIRAQYARQNGRCIYCHEKVGDTYHRDHVMPLVLGGSNGPENIVIACPTCNLSKGAKHPMDFSGRLL